MLKRKPRDAFKPAADASRDLADATAIVRHLSTRLDGMPGGERVVAALIELRDVAAGVVTCQTMR